MHAIALEVVVGCVLAVSRCMRWYFEAMTRRSAMRHLEKLADSQPGFTAKDRIRLGELIKDIARPDPQPFALKAEPSRDRKARKGGHPAK